MKVPSGSRRLTLVSGASCDSHAARSYISPEVNSGRSIPQACDGIELCNRYDLRTDHSKRLLRARLEAGITRFHALWGVGPFFEGRGATYLDTFELLGHDTEI